MWRFAMVSMLVAGCGKNGGGDKIAGSGPPTAAPATAVKVMYSASGDADVTKEQYRLWGVSSDGSTAYVLRERRLDDPPLWALDTIDLRAGKRTATWETKAQREYVELLPVDGTVEQAAVRFAALAAQTGPWSTRTATHWVEAQPLHGGGLVYRTPALRLADKDGAEVRELGEADDLRVSPDGKRLLWIEDVEAFSKGRVVIAEVAGGEPRRSEERGWLREPMWSADGSAIYAVEAKGSDDRKPCLVRIAAADLAATPLACLEGTQPSIAQDPSGATAVFAVKTGGASALSWIDLRTGKVRIERVGLPALAPQLEDVLLGDRGWLISISPEWTTLIAIDLASGKVATLPGGDGGFWEGVRASRWLGDRIVVLRRRGTTVELVEVDVAAMFRAG